MVAIKFLGLIANVGMLSREMKEKSKNIPLIVLLSIGAILIITSWFI